MQTDQRTDILVVQSDVIKQVDCAFTVHCSLDAKVASVHRMLAKPGAIDIVLRGDDKDDMVEQ